MTAYDNIITTEDTVAALDQEFLRNFRGDYDRFAEILGLFPVQTMAAGTALYQYKVTGELADKAQDGDAPEKGSSGKSYEEGDFIARSKYVVEKVPIGEIEFAPYAKQTTAQAILKGGFENAVLRSDRKALQQLRASILGDFFTFLGNGTGTATGVGLQGALAQMDAVLANSMETNGDEPGAIVHFVNRLDAADYLGKASVTMQTAFGLTYLESFLGIENVILTNKVERGTALATPVENIHIYGLDFAALGNAGLVYESEDLGLVGVHHAADYDYASAETYIVRGATFLPEVTDYIVKGTVAASAQGGNMEAKVTKAFGDRLKGDRLYMPGDSFEANEPRIAELEALGIVERIAEGSQEAGDDPEPKPETEPEAKPATRKRAAKAKE